MPAKQEPNIGINYGWAGGESGINLQLDENWRAIGALLQLSVISKTTDVPTTPVDGDRYIIPSGATGAWSSHDGKVARYNEATWEIYTPLKGWLAYIDDEAVDGQYQFFDGTNWVPAPIDDAGQVAYSNLLSGLTAIDVQSAIDELADRPLGGGVQSVDGKTGEVDLSGSYEAKRKNNLSATTDPAVTDDSSLGYEPLSRWINTSTGEIWLCVDAAAGAANWQKASLTLDELGSAAVVDVGVTASQVPQNSDLGSAAYTPSTDYEVSGAVATHEGKTDPHNQYVQKVTGKGLSTEDYTTAEQTKLAGIESGAEVNAVDTVQGETGDVDLSNYFEPRRSANVVWDSTSDTYSRDGLTTGVTPIHERMRRCLLNDDGTVNYHLDPNDSTLKADGTAAVLDGTDGQVMVEIPKCYVRVTKLFNGDIKREISEYPRSGFVLHPEFAVGGTLQHDPALDMWYYTNPTGEKSATYVGAYQASVYDTSGAAYIDGLNLDNNDSRVDYTADILGSVSGKYPMVGVTRAQMWQLAGNRGADWSQWTFWQWSLVKLLFFVEYGGFDGQSLLAAGNDNVSTGYQASSSNQTDSPHSIAGKSNVIGNGSGGVASSVRDTAWMSYRGIENFWGNTWQFCDGFNVNDWVWYVSNDPATFGDDTTTGYNQLGVAAPSSNGYIRNVQHNTLGDVVADSTGNSSTAFADYYYQNPGWRMPLVGGHATNGSLVGPSCVSVYYDSGNRNRLISGRLAFSKPQ